jgi:hypothetical protein
MQVYSEKAYTTFRIALTRIVVYGICYSKLRVFDGLGKHDDIYRKEDF